MFEELDHRGTTRGALAALAAAAASVLVLSPTAGANVRADFNDDGFEDLAIGIEGEDLPPPEDVLNAGAVEVIYGSAAGLDAVGPPDDQFWHEEVHGVRGTGTNDDGFGTAVAAGDFDGDGRADLAIGVAGDIVKGEQYAGSVRVLYGTNGGLGVDGDELFTEATKGVPGKAKEDDELGEHLAAGDFDGDGRDDLAASIGHEQVDGKEAAGAILTLYGSQNGLRVQGVQRWTEKSPGIAGVPADFDEFGNALAVGDLEGNGRDDLAFGVHGDKVGGQGAAGTARVIFGSGKGLTRSGDRRFAAGQGSIPGAPFSGEFFGESVAVGRIDAGPDADLAIGTTGDGVTVGGSATVLYSGGQGPTAQGASDLWSQGAANVEGTPLAADRFGASLVVADFDGNSREDLAIGVPGDDDPGASAGSVNVLYAESGGLSVTADQLFHQATANVEGTVEANDQFGMVLGAGDFDDSGGTDLAASVLSDDAGAVDDAGSVEVLYALLSGPLDAAGDQLWHQAVANVESDPTPGEGFGFSLAAGS